MDAIKSKFCLNDSNYFPGYTFGQTWNGWACPYFTLRTALKVMEVYNEGRGEDQPIIYNKKNKSFIVDGEEIKTTTVKTVNGIKELYPLGAYGWCWWDFKWNN